MVNRSFRAGLLVLALAAAASPGKAENANPFASFAGNWSGGGQVQFEGGRTERLSCKGYYTNKSADELGMAIRCASTSTKIELRSQLRYAGGKVTGTWEERTFNAIGDITGRATGSSLKLDIAGGGLTGAMAMSVSGSVQTVSITTSGTTLKGVSINMSRG